MSAPSSSSYNQSTSHGHVYFYNGSAAAQAVMNAMVRIEMAQAEAQQQQAEELLRRAGGSQVVDPISVGLLVATIAGVAATAAGAAAAAVSAGAGIASVVNQANSGGLPSLEVEVDNRSSSPVVLSSYSSADSTTVSLPSPLEPGQASTALVVNSTGEFGEGDSNLAMTFLTGGAVDDSEQPTTPISATFTMKYNSSGNWVPQLKIDGSSTQTASDEKSLFAAYFQSSSDSSLDFTVVSIGSEKSTSQNWVHFLPSAATL